MENENFEDITPEDSFSPVYLDPTPMEPTNLPDVVALAETELSAKETAVEEIMANGYSESTARIMAGLPPLPS